MKKTFLFFCIAFLLSSQVLAYEISDSYVDSYGRLLYVVQQDDGSFEEMLPSEYESFVAEQRAKAASDIEEGQVITASGDVIDYEDYAIL